MNSAATLLSFYSDYSAPMQCATRCDLRIMDDKHDRFLTFIALCHKLDVDFFTSTWQAGHQPLGSGGTSVVSQGTGLGISTSYAFKRVMTPTFASKEEMQDFKSLALYALSCEVSILSSQAAKLHPYIIDLVGVSFEVVEAYEGTMCVWPVLIFPKAHWYNLADFVTQCELGGGLDMEHRINIVLQVWAAVTYVHGTLAAMHGDIKPSNVLVFHEDERLIVKLIDFGYSSIFCEGLESLINIPISMPWYAPELKDHSGSFSILEARKADIFSFGVFAMWVLFGNAWLDPPDESVNEENSMDNSENMSQNRWIQHIEECKSQDGLVQAACELLARCEEIETRHKGWMRSFFEKALPCNPTGRESSMAALFSDLKDNEEFALYPSYIFDDGEELVFGPGDEDYPRADPVTEEEKIARESWGDCVQLDITFLFEEFSTTDYRVRKYLIQCLEAQADKESCASCQQQAAYILAVFIRIGFGCSQDTERSQRYLLQSLRPHSDLSEAIKNLKYGGRSIAEDSTEESDVMALDIPFADIDSEYLDSQNAAMVYKELHTELLALEKSLGQGHRTVIDMKKSVLRIQELRGYWDDVEILAQDLIAALSEAPNHSLQQMMLWDVQSTYAHCLSAKGQVQSAEELFLDLYSQAKSIFGPNHLVVLGHLRALCTFWMAMSEDAKVEEHLSDLGLFEPDRETPKPSNMHYANLAILLGSNYVDQGRYDDAERMIVPAVELIKGTHGDGHPQSLLVLVHLVILYIKTERLDVAEEVALHIQGSWEMFAYHNGAPAPSYPRSLNLLAQVYAAQDRLDEAIRTIQKATTIHYRFFAFEKLAELDYLDSEACFLLKLERWDEGVHQQRKVTELSQEILGYRHQDSRDRVVGLAAAYLLSDNLALAERVLMALLRDLEEDPTASKSNLMACTEHLAELRQRQARFEEAIHFAEIALGCASELRGKRDVKPTNFMRKIAELYNEDKSYSKALAIRIQILDLIETESSENSEQVVDAMEDVADVYFHLRDFTNAELYYRKALKACQTGLGTKHEMYIRLLGSLASTIEEDPNRVDEVTEIEEEIDALEDDMDDIVSELA